MAINTLINLQNNSWGSGWMERWKTLVVFTLITSTFMQRWGSLGLISGGVHNRCLPTPVRSEPVFRQKPGVSNTGGVHQTIHGFIRVFENT